MDYLFEQNHINCRRVSNEVVTNLPTKPAAFIVTLTKGFSEMNLLAASTTLGGLKDDEGL
jgi:hypothetical protein